MAAQRKPAQNKASRKPSEPTPIGDVIKGMPPKIKASKKPSEPTPIGDVIKGMPPKIKASKKVTKTVKKKEPAKPKITQKMFEQHFYALAQDEFKALCQIYVEQQLDFKIEQQPDYDHWFNYFKKIPASHVRILVRIGQDILDSEAYSALRLWHDIISNPQRIAKVHQTSLTSMGGNDKDSIVAMALKNDRYGVLCATRDEIAKKLQKGAGARDTAALARELTEVMTQIADYEKRQGPKKDTKLGKLLDGMPGRTVGITEGKKRPAKNGGGKRNTSYASRVTIKDVEG